MKSDVPNPTAACPVDRTSSRHIIQSRYDRAMGLPRAAVTGGDRPLPSLSASVAGLAIRQTLFPETPPATAYETPFAARRAIADQLARPLGSLAEDDLAFIDEILSETLERQVISERVRERFNLRR